MDPNRTGFSAEIAAISGQCAAAATQMKVIAAEVLVKASSRGALPKSTRKAYRAEGGPRVSLFLALKIAILLSGIERAERIA